MPRLSISYSGNSSSNTATSTSSVYITDSGERRIIAFVTGPRGPQGPSGVDGTGAGADLSGYITTGQADLRYYPLNSNPSGYIQNSGFLTGFDSGAYVTKSETGQFYPSSNPSGFSTTDQLAQTGATLNTKINSLSGYANTLSGNLQININALDVRLQSTGSLLYTLFTGIPTPTGYITTGQADARYYGINNPSGYITGFNSGNYINRSETGQFYPSSNPLGYANSGNLAMTGQQAIVFSNSNSFNLSGNLGQTGSLLLARDLSTSGVLNLAINSLSGFSTGFSGYLQSQINLLPTSANLALTGSNLFAIITGLSGGFDSRIQSTGSLLVTLNLATSGALQAQLGNAGAQIRVTGSSLISTGDFSGIGGTIIIYSGNKILISGGGAGDVSLAQLNSLSGFTTGLSGALQGQINALPTAANLASTGSSLFNLITGLSGQNVIDYATKLSLTQTGVNIYSSINFLSGFVTGTSGSLQTQINTLATNANLSLTGSSLFVLLTGLSGQAVSDYATKVSLLATGQQVWNATQNNALNLSGNLTLTGQTLGNSINSLSGFTTGVSGFLRSLIEDSAGGVSSINGQSGTLNINGLGNISVTTGANTIFVSGDTGAYINFATVLNLVATGAVLMARDLAISGALQTQITFGNATGNSQFASKLISIPTGFYSLDIPFDVSFSSTPIVVGNMIYTGNLIISPTITYINSTGFGLLFTDIISDSGYTYNYLAISGNLLNVTSTGGGGVSGVSQAQLNSLSGWASSNLTQTGAVLGGQINSLSGFVGGVSGSLQTQINTLATSANLALTGNSLFNLITGLSGQSNINYATNANLALTGSNLLGLLTGSSGLLNTQIASTGSQAWNTANNNSINLSGNLTLTGQTLFNRDVSISGGLEARIGASGSSLFNLLTGTSGALDTKIFNLSGFGSATYSTITNLGLTGSNLLLNIAGLSGAFDTKIQSTGQQTWNAAQNNAVNLSGNLTQTGVALLARDLLTSGVLATGIAATGAAAVAYTNSVGTSISGNLALTGSQAWNAANNNGVNLSGNLSQTGIALIARDLAISGALQAQIGVAGTQVKVTGSASISIADFTGIGTTLVFVSGGQIFISGAPAGAGAGDVTQAQLDSLSGWTNSNISQTGSNLYNLITSLSGSITGGSSSPATWTEIQIDFGTGKPVYDKTFIITDSSVSTGSKIVVLPCGKTASGQQDGDWLWDGLTLAALPGSGSFTLFSAPIPGPIKGKRVIQYQVTI